MIVLELYLSLLPLLLNYNDASKNEVLIIGSAYNEKDGAWVYSERVEQNYFIEGIDSWNDKIIGKKVKVCGKLLIEEIIHKPQGKSTAPGITPPPPRQELQGVFKRNILNAKWKLVK